VFGHSFDTVLTHADYHILVTDKAPVGESFLALLLGPIGYRITSVQSSIEAVAVLRSDPADVILVDLEAGDAVELGLLVMLRKFFPALPMVLCVGGHSEAQGAQYRQLGVVDIWAKPVDPRAIVEQIGLALPKRGLQPGQGSVCLTAAEWLAEATKASGGGEEWGVGARGVPLRLGRSEQVRELNKDFARLRGFGSLAVLESRLGFGVLDLAVDLVRAPDSLLVACLAGWIDRAVLTELLAPAQDNDRPVVLVVLESENLDAQKQLLVEGLLCRRPGDALSECFGGRVRVLLCAAESLCARAEQGRFSELLLMRAGAMVKQVPALVQRREDLWVMALAIWARTGSGAVMIDPACELWVREQSWPGDYGPFHRTIELAGHFAQKAGGPVTPRELDRAVALEPTWVKPLYHELRLTELAGPLVEWD
jgi:CheY-like chemotaxis protein